MFRVFKISSNLNILKTPNTKLKILAIYIRLFIKYKNKILFFAFCVYPITYTHTTLIKIKNNFFSNKQTKKKIK